MVRTAMADAGYLRALSQLISVSELFMTEQTDQP
jgi:hypothetical protein